MKWLRGVIAAAVLAMVAVPAVGQTDSLRFVNAGSTISNGYYVGPYKAQIFTAPGAPYVDIYCVDFLHSIHWGQRWEANFTSLGAGEAAISANTRWGGALTSALTSSGVFENYGRAAWLSSQFAVTEKAKWGELHQAIWQLFTIPEGSSTPMWYGASVIQAWWDKADVWDDQQLGINLSEWSVVTDVQVTADGQRGVQEFLLQTNVVPEPATIILMGTGLVAVMGMTVVMRQSVG